ncbi:MAG: 30S ribosomal protein S12 methylthiotransferase RimO [Armatimonadetes bacterium]|nr:30S ribosomal protein S12 methylthiotransferase RimO [Armatimonadota bacterium]
MPDSPPLRAPKVKIVTLGCAKNDVDSEEIAGVLAESGYQIDGGARKADVVVINTCGFLEAAKEESVRAIREAVRERKAGRIGKVIVAGCLAQRLGPELAKLAPGADTYVGVGQMARFGEIVGGVRGLGSGVRGTGVGQGLLRKEAIISSATGLPRSQSGPPDQVPQTPTPEPHSPNIDPPHHLWADVKTRIRSGHPWSAYLKVSEGCDHKCTFCTIPSFRGAHQSKPIERLVEEARFLASTGAKELNLIAQDVTQYGYDLYREFTLPRLLRELNGIDGIEWIRILYFYPNRLTDEVVEAMATLPKVLPYIDIPLQHAHPETLRRMKRPWDGERYLKLFENLRTAMPECAIRTTFIVGFPGETDEEFEYLLEFMRSARLDRVGAFKYSREPGTPSHDMEGQVSPRVKQLRYDTLMRLQQGISLEVNQGWVGKKLKVLVEGEVAGGQVVRFSGSQVVGGSGDEVFRSSGSQVAGGTGPENLKTQNLNTQNLNTTLIARSHRDAPEIDGLVYVEGPRSEVRGQGEFMEVEVTKAGEYDLWAS